MAKIYIRNEKSGTPVESMSASNSVAEDTSVRWGGLVLTIGILALLVSIILYISVLGSPEGTGPDGEVTNQDFAQHIMAYEILTRFIWFNEMASAFLIAIAAFTLRGRASRHASRWPMTLLWTTVGIGATGQVVGYGFTLGSYWHATEVVDTTPALFDALRGASSMIFGIGTLAVMGGLALLLIAEARSVERTVHAPIAYVGGAAGIIGLGYPLSFITSFDAFLITAPLAFLFFPAVAYFGAMIWLHGRAGVGLETDMVDLEVVESG